MDDIVLYRYIYIYKYAITYKYFNVASTCSVDHYNVYNNM